MHIQAKQPRTQVTTNVEVEIISDNVEENEELKEDLLNNEDWDTPGNGDAIPSDQENVDPNQSTTKVRSPSAAEIIELNKIIQEPTDIENEENDNVDETMDSEHLNNHEMEIQKEQEYANEIEKEKEVRFCILEYIL